MSKLVTVATFTYPSELVAIRGRLESEGIRCFVKDELTVQTYNFISNAVGGIKLQVRERDAEKAIEILLETGYIKASDFKPPAYVVKFDQFTSKIPLLNKLIIEFRFVAIAAFIIFVLLIAVYFLLQPSLNAQLTGQPWCLTHFTYNEEVFEPAFHTDFQISFGNCLNGMLFFSENGKLRLPAFNSRFIDGEWSYENKQLTISGLDTLGHILHGSYDVRLKHDELKLVSDKTIIYCYKINLF